MLRVATGPGRDLLVTEGLLAGTMGRSGACRGDGSEMFLVGVGVLENGADMAVSFSGISCFMLADCRFILLIARSIGQ